MKKNNKKGFTLVELVIVVAVMAILVAVAIPVVGNITSSAQDSVNKSNAQTIESMIKLVEANSTKDNEGEVVLTEAAIDEALTEAKLGIDGTFYYFATTGVCVHSETDGAGTPAVGDFTIVFDSDSTSTTETNGTDTTVVVTKVTSNDD